MKVPGGVAASVRLKVSCVCGEVGKRKRSDVPSFMAVAILRWRGRRVKPTIPLPLGEGERLHIRCRASTSPARAAPASAWIAYLESFRSELEDLFLAGVEFNRRVQSLWLP